ncbi:MAG: InlB B-repeat-containing protein [Treponema sp.]|nr:InlB B-repeat-containing protein [Treponema sp.]
MKFKRSIFAALVFSVLFTSCFNNLKAPKETSVSFYMDEATVQKILQTSVKARSAASSRAAADEQNDTAGYFIDVTLIGEVEQTQTASLSTDVQMSFTNILVNSRVYAKAQIYKYLNSEQSEKEIIYRGESKKITVRDNGNVLSIKLTTATLTVTFDSNGGSEVPSQLVQTGSAATEPEKPVKPADKKKYSRENYAFAGWFTDPELTKEYNFELPVKDDLTLYAKWLPDFVFVEGATVNDYLVTGRNVKISDLFVSDHEVTQAEYKAVIGSNPSNNKTADDLPVENVTWFEAIEYCNKLSESQGLDPCYKINGSEVTCTLSANGYRLPTEAEWEYIANKAKRENTSFSNLAWTADNSGNNTHQVKYNLADELCLCDIYGNVAEWCFDVYSDTVTKSTGPTGPMAVAGTSANRVVRGGSFQSSAAECTPQTRACADPAEKSAAIGFRVVRTVVYEFKIARNTVTFEPNGGSSVEVQIVIQGDCATEPADPTRTGYIFKGWQYADEDFDFSTSITQDIMLEAKWEAIKYKVIFNTNFPAGSTGGSGSFSDFNATYDQIIELPNISSITSPNGYHFKVWSLAPDSETLTYDTSNPAIKNLVSQDNETITLYVIWDENEKHYIHYQNYDYDDVSVSGLKTDFKESVDVNNTEILSPSGTRTGYTFSGWYYSDADENVTTTQFAGWSAGDKTTDIYLYAQWDPITYKVRFKSRNNLTTGTMSDQTITYDTATELTECAYALTGYDFAGWTTNENATSPSAKQFNDKEAVTNLSSTQDAIVNLYALWTPTTYKVIYNLDDGTLGGTHNYDSDSGKYYDEFTIESEDLTLPTTITKDGAVFDGWYTSSTDFSAANKIETISAGTHENKPVYAKWNYLITFTLISGDWSSSGGGSELSMTIKADGATVTAATPVTGTTIVFTPSFTQTGYTCTWKIDGSAPDSSWATVNSTTNELTLTTTGITPGVYAIQFTASKGSSYESYYAQIRIN